MYVDSRAVEQGSVVVADICIMGAGAAGITLALELAGSPYRVAIIESGGFDYDAETHKLTNAINIGRPYGWLPRSRSRYFGGSTNHWGGHCVPLNKIDLEQRQGVPHRGWPMGYEELTRYYPRAHEILKIGEYNYDVDRIRREYAKQIFPFDSKNVETVVSRYRATRFGKEYRTEIGTAANITTYLNGNVVNINREKDRAVIRSILVRTLSGNVFSITAKYFVLGLGGIENARMLLISNDIETAGLGNEFDLVGRYFMDHIWYPSGYIVPIEQSSKLDFYTRRITVGSKFAYRAHLALPPRKIHETRIPAYRVEIAEIDLAEIEEADSFGSHLLDVATTLTRIRRRLPNKESFAYKLLNSVEQVPNAESRIGLAREKDALGLNLMTVDWRLSEVDKIGIKEAQRSIAAEVGRCGFGRMRIDLVEDEDLLLEGADGGCHHMGTTRMANSPRQGVVDANCKVHGLRNLFIAGSSVFPTAGYSNPTLTIVALAVRLSAHLESLMSSRGGP